MSSPLLSYAGLLERSTHLVHLYLQDDPAVQQYQFLGHRTVDDAYGDPLDSGVGGAGAQPLFTVPRGQSFRSPALIRKKLGLVEENRRGTTHVLYDVDDFIAVGAGGSPTPPDEDWMFVRVQEQRATGLLYYPDVPEATVTLAAVAALDELIVKGVYFRFQAGANNLGGKAGNAGDPFLVGLGADDDAAAANFTAALNDGVDVGPAMDLIAPLSAHTFATNVGAPSAVVLIQPENGTPDLIPGSVAAFTITTTDAPRIAIDAAALAAGTLVAAADTDAPVAGPIYCIPPATFFGTRYPTFTLQGTAPSGTESSAGGWPDLSEDITVARPRALYLVFPKPLTALSIRNLSAVVLLVSFGPGMAMQGVPAGGELPLYSGTTKEVLLASATGVAGAAFSLHGVAAGET